MGIQLLEQKFVQQRGLEEGLLVAEGLPEEDQRHHRLAAGVQPQGVEGIQRLLGGLMEREVEQEAACLR